MATDSSTEGGQTTTHGSLSDMSLRDAKRAQAGQQVTFNEFSGNGETTYVAVTRSPSEDLEEIADCVYEDLGPPWYLFNEFISLRSDYMDRGYSKEAAHNKAWEESDYGERFSKYLWWDESDTEDYEEKGNGLEPRSAILDIIDRIESGENIVLVCYCKDEMKCHRKLVRSDIEQWLRILESMREKEPATSSEEEVAEMLGLERNQSTQLELSEIEP